MKTHLKNITGFTLIELLLVVAILGILSAISIPVFRDYTKRGFNAAATADLRNFKAQMEASYSESQSYPLY